ncbi:hypothetical protein [Streptomyces sp. 1222.5]|uniref:hypothetical protein n=1 Tax=Streptomyces sp. 1222.5 TaxID=1881026 RepID=UPI003EBD1FED
MAARTRIVESADTYWHGDTECWLVVTRATDGHGLTHVFPKSTLEWRAAEYGIDPADVDALLDVILHERFVDDEQPGVAARSLAQAASTGDARRAHLARIAALKKDRERVDLGGKGSPLAAIRARPEITAAGVRAKRELVDERRWTRLYGALPLPEPPTIPVALTSAVEVPRA